MGQPITLKKISEQLNLSISTISRALKNHPDISEKTKNKVKELAAIMEYEPNSYAVNLRTNKSRVLGLIVPVISNFFYDSFIASAEEDARKNGYSLMILQSGNDPVQEEENLKLCKLSRVDGIFISVVPGSYSHQFYKKFQGSNTPVIFFDQVPETGSFDSICMADSEAATIAAHTILKYNKKNILAIFGNTGLSISKKRKEAFLFTLKGKGKNVTINLHHASSTEVARQITAAELLKFPKTDLIFCMSDEILIGTMKQLNKTGLRTPGDISVLAISNGFIPGLFYPEITYVETNGFNLGKLAVQRMLELLDSESDPKSILLPSRLVEGGSLS